MNHINDRLLVTGATGHLGRAVVEELLRRGAKNVIATGRTLDKLAELKARGVETRVADFDRPETLRSAFAGVDRLVIISTDATADPGERLKQHRAAVAAAIESGVKHVVYTSATAPHPTAESSLINDHFWTEAALIASPLSWTILRNDLYMEVILMGVEETIKSGKLFSATGGKGRSYVSREDCARAIAGALLEAQRSEILDVTGAVAVTQDDVAAMLSEVTGKSIVHVAVPPQSLTDGLSHAGVPPRMIKMIVDFDVEASQGYHALVTPTVERLTGNAPMPLMDFLRKHLAAS